ncbi:MAG: J domain-containing protein [Bacteroidetes bacterium]|nr:MAG: J domain-containing protein [Bacteroidota bacterium]
MLKDYYNILQIPPHASLLEIKQAHRRLAMIYHPDKTKDDPYADTKYEEIREAYEVLSNQGRKEAYLQERWYDQSIGQKRKVGATTPVSILRLSLELEKYVSSLDVHRMNKEGLYNYINELLSSDTVENLNRYDETAITQQIINTILMAMKPLQLNFAIALSNKLEKLANHDEISLQRITSSLRQHQKSFLWKRYQFFLIIVITVLICLLIFLTSK